MAGLVKSHFGVEVHKKAFDIAMELFAHSQKFPKEERFSLTD